MARGGRRAGKPGTNYANRSDLRTPTPVALPKTAVPGGEYGSVTNQLTAQAAVPMASGPLNAAPSPGGAAAPGPGGTPPAGPGAPDFTLTRPGPLPGQLPGLHEPTARPDEPLTAGVGVINPGTTGAPVQTTAMFLQHLAAQPGAPAEIVALAQVAGRSG